MDLIFSTKSFKIFSFGYPRVFLYLGGRFALLNVRINEDFVHHSFPTILACPVVSSSIGVQIRRIDFSEPQGGKGAADCLPATCKAHVHIFMSEGHDVMNATLLKGALV